MTQHSPQKSLSEDGTHVIDHDLGQNLHWMHGLEEYLEYTDHKQKEKYSNLKRAVMLGNIWHIRDLLRDEIHRGPIEHTDEFLQILLAHYTGYDSINHRKVLRYVAHCIDSDYIRRISSWAIKWQYRANLNEHFSRGQMKSKCWLVEEMSNVFPNKHLGTVVHYGGWYATVAKNLFEQYEIKNYYNLELDPNCIEIADEFNYEQYQNQWQFKSVVQDCSTIKYNKEGAIYINAVNRAKNTFKIKVKPDIIINTSCEHMNEDWFNNLPDGQLVCLQTNDYFSNEQHVNCVHGVQEAKAKYPMTEVLYEGEIDTHLYNRFMLIGRK